jgi:hypothetical protein
MIPGLYITDKLAVSQLVKKFPARIRTAEFVGAGLSILS